jgi:hypothetical protein
MTVYIPPYQITPAITTAYRHTYAVITASKLFKPHSPSKTTPSA